MQVTPPVLIVAAMVTLLFVVPAVGLAASAAVYAELSAELRMAFIALSLAWAAIMARLMGA